MESNHLSATPVDDLQNFKSKNPLWEIRHKGIEPLQMEHQFALQG